MNYSKTFSYNADFGWYENQITLGKQSIQLLVSSEVTLDWALDFEWLHQRLKEVVNWVIKNQPQWESYCRNLQEGDHVDLVMVSLEKQQHFELMFKVQDKEQFALLSFNEAFQLENWQVDG
ncbi:hypothetical protein BKI52_40875 [marine bacterium AO1-C]|nr:hypothetical protein BKI52_40875 [marine bacterium AO1-C]